MNTEVDFLTNAHYLEQLGTILSPETRAAISASLLILKTNYNFTKLHFWGKITGVSGDYCIALGSEKGCVERPYKTFFSQDGVGWAQLPDVSDEAKVILVENGLQPDSQVPLSGDPSVNYKHRKPGQEEDDEEEEEEVEEEEGDEEKPPAVVPPPVTELHRVALLVEAISAQTTIVPIGALLLTGNGCVFGNTAYKGLTPEEAQKLSSYARLGDVIPHLLKNKILDEFADQHGLANIGEDKLKGMWVQSYNPVTRIAALKNLTYPGHVTYVIAGTPVYVSSYFGNGLKNADIQFAL